MKDERLVSKMEGKVIFRGAWNSLMALPDWPWPAPFTQLYACTGSVYANMQTPGQDWTRKVHPPLFVATSVLAGQVSSFSSLTGLRHRPVMPASDQGGVSFGYVSKQTKTSCTDYVWQKWLVGSWSYLVVGKVLWPPTRQWQKKRKMKHKIAK